MQHKLVNQLGWPLWYYGKCSKTKRKLKRIKKEKYFQFVNSILYKIIKLSSNQLMWILFCVWSLCSEYSYITHHDSVSILFSFKTWTFEIAFSNWGMVSWSLIFKIAKDICQSYLFRDAITFNLSLDVLKQYHKWSKLDVHNLEN